MASDRRALARWLLPVLFVLAALPLAGCEELREVRKALEGTQETSQPAPAPGAQTSPVPRPAEGTAPARAGAAGENVAARPGPSGSIPGTAPQVPLPGSAGTGTITPAPGVQLTPPPGVVPVVRVAILLPLSGPEARVGQALLNAAQLALFSLADDSFALLPVDTRGTPEGAAVAARSAIEDGARLILGPVFSSSVAAAAPVARAAGVPVISFSNDRSVAGNGVYIMGFTPETQIGRVAAYAAARGVRRIAAIVPEGPFGARVEESLAAATAASGMTLARVVRYRSADTQSLSPLVRGLANYDARRGALLSRRKELGEQDDEASRRALKRLENLDTLGDVDFDAVLMPEGGSALRALAPLLPFFDIDPRKVRMLGSAQWDDPTVATEPSLFGGWFPAPAPEGRRIFDDVYRKTYGDAPPRIASLAYDATALAAVLVRAPAEPARVAAGGSPGAPAIAPATVPRPDLFRAQALTAANGFSGVDGIFRLLPSGLAERGLAVLEVRDRRFVVVSPAPTTFQKPGP